MALPSPRQRQNQKAKMGDPQKGGVQTDATPFGSTISGRIEHNASSCVRKRGTSDRRPLVAEFSIIAQNSQAMLQSQIAGKEGGVRQRA